MSRYRAAIRPRCAMIRRWGLRYARHSARVSAAIRPRGAYDTTNAGPRYGATAPPDTSQCALPGRSARGLCEQAGFRVCTWCTNPVLTQCTVLSHCLGTLFMNTVHEHCSRGFQK